MKKPKPHHQSKALSKDTNTIDIGSVRVFSIKKTVDWFFTIDNFKLAIAIAGVILSVVYNQINHMHRIKTQLSEAFLENEKMRVAHSDEEGRLNERILHLENKVDVLQSESRIFQDSLNDCRSTLRMRH